MRIEINSGGLTTGCTLGVLREDLEHSIQRTEQYLEGLRAIKRYTYTINGGVGILQPALNDISSSITREEQHLSNMNDAEQRVGQFVEYARRTDLKVAADVNKNKDMFYQVNPWAKPAPTGRPGVTIGGGTLLDKLLSIIGGWTNRAHPSGGGGHWRNPAALLGFGVGGVLGGTGIGYGLSGGLYGPRTETDGNVTTKSAFSAGVNGSVGKNGTGAEFDATLYGPKAQWGDGKASASVTSGEFNGKVTVAGNEIGSVKAGVDMLGASAEGKAGAEFGFDEETGKFSAFVGAGGEAEAHVFKGSVETKSFGLIGNKQELTVGSASVEGKVGASLFENGEFTPSLQAKASAEAVVAKGDVTQTFGTENFNYYNNASGKVLGAEAKANAGIGKVSYTDKTTGEVKTGYGVAAEAGAEAYIAQGTVKSGVTVMGVKIDAGVTGKYGAVGAKAGGHLTTGEVGGHLDLGLGLGLGLDVNIDFSDAKLVNPVTEFREQVPFVDDVFDYFGW